MPTASLEAMLDLWSTSLCDARDRIQPLFATPSIARSASAFLDGLLGAERRKTGWMRAEAAGDPGPWRQQAVVGRSQWDADALRDVVREHMAEALAEPDAVLVIDEIGFLKQGKASCGVHRQYIGSAGKFTNCQIGVFAAYVSTKGHAFLDRALHLPKAWTDDPRRRAATHVPETLVFAIKPQLALTMIERAMATDVPFAWVAANSVSGVDEIEMALRREAKGYVLGVAASDRFNSWIDKPEVAGTAEAVADALDPGAWQRLSAGRGIKGERFYDWAYCELADVEVGKKADARSEVWTRGLLVRRRISDGQRAYFTTWCPAGTSLQTLVRIEGRRWAIEEAFETGRTELGLDHNETRSWHGWHRHVSLVMLAFAVLARVRQRANGPPPKTERRAKLARALVAAEDPARRDPARATAH